MNVNWLEGMNRAIAYIEGNLAEEIDYVNVAKIVNCSVYHFQKLFILMTGIPLSEYVRRRRLSLAAVELQTTDVKVIDLALKYGYQSPTAFNRAFQQMHNITPSQARKTGAVIKAYSPLSFQITIKGAVEMDYRIEQKEAFRVVGVKLHTTMENEESFKVIPEFWTACHQDGTVKSLLPLMDQEPFGIMGLSHNMTPSKPEFDYYIAVSSSKAPPKGLSELIVPASTWAIFTSIGPMPNAIQDLIKKIMTEWFPTSGYEYANAADIELYGDGDPQSEDYRCEVWVPVVQKK